MENELDSTEASSHSKVNNDGCIKRKIAQSVALVNLEHLLLKDSIKNTTSHLERFSGLRPRNFKLDGFYLGKKEVRKVTIQKLHENFWFSVFMTFSGK